MSSFPIKDVIMLVMPSPHSTILTTVITDSNSSSSNTRKTAAASALWSSDNLLHLHSYWGTPLSFQSSCAYFEGLWSFPSSYPPISSSSSLLADI